MNAPLHWVIKALAADLRANGASLPCAILGQLVRGEAAVDTSTGVLKAILLASLQYRVAVHLLGDADPAVPWTPATCRPWDEAMAPGRKVVAADLFELHPRNRDRSVRNGGEGSLAASVQARQFLQSVPIELLTEMLNWAPPVVSGPNGDGRYWVLGNALMAAIARLVMPTARVSVRVLERQAESDFALLDLARAARALLGPIAEMYLHLTIRASPNLAAAMWLTGRKRSWCAQVRNREGVLSI